MGPLYALVLCSLLVSSVLAKKIKCPPACSCVRSATGIVTRCVEPNFPSIPRSIPRLTKELYITSGFNFTRIKKNDLRGFKSLEILSLEKNRIRHIDKGAFRFLQNLQKLYLHGNIIQKLSKDTFKGLPKLQVLTLHENQLTQIEPGAFRNLSSLQELHMFRNGLYKLEYKTFEGLENVKTITMGLNAIGVIEPGALKGLNNIQTLSLNNNRIKKIYSRMLVDLVTLKRLFLFANQIEVIERGAFYRNPDLELLSLFGNKLTELQDGTFAGLLSLKELYLYNNQLHEIQPGSFRSMDKLERLHIYGNKIQAIRRQVFSGLKTLQELQLAVNSISLIEDRAFEDLSALLSLFLDSNKLTTLTNETFVGLTSVIDVYIYFNQISYIEEGALDTMQSLRALIWEVPAVLQERLPNFRKKYANNLHCDRNAMWLKKWIASRSHIDFKVKCFTPETLSNQSIVSVEDGNFTCAGSGKMTMEPKKLTVGVDKVALIRCSIFPGGSYRWMRSGQVVQSDRRVAVESMGVLRIDRVKPDDAGEYICLGEHKCGLSAETVQLIIGEKPRFVDYPIDTVVQIKDADDQTIVLPCKAVGLPKPRVFWYKDGDPVDPPSPSRNESLDIDNYHGNTRKRIMTSVDGPLIIRSVSVEDAGVYACIAENSAGRKHASCNVEVQIGSHCSTRCENGGRCATVHQCVCLSDYTGNYCEQDKQSLTFSGSDLDDLSGSGSDDLESSSGQDYSGDSETMKDKGITRRQNTEPIFTELDLEIISGSGSGSGSGDDTETGDIIDYDQSGYSGYWKDDIKEDSTRRRRSLGLEFSLSADENP